MGGCIGKWDVGYWGKNIVGCGILGINNSGIWDFLKGQKNMWDVGQNIFLHFYLIKFVLLNHFKCRFPMNGLAHGNIGTKPVICVLTFELLHILIVENMSAVHMTSSW